MDEAEPRAAKLRGGEAESMEQDRQSKDLGLFRAFPRQNFWSTMFTRLLTASLNTLECGKLAYFADIWC